MKNLSAILKKSTAAILFPFVLSTNFSGLINKISAAPSLTNLGSRLVRHFYPAAEKLKYQEIKVIATAYSSTPDQTDHDPYITAANTKARDGVVALNFLKLHSRVKIPELYGDKIFVVEDRMNRRFTDAVPPRIDIWMPTRWRAKRFGVKKTAIILLD